jgi:hypothetical protein
MTEKTNSHFNQDGSTMQRKQKETYKKPQQIPQKTWRIKVVEATNQTEDVIKQKNQQTSSFDLKPLYATLPTLEGMVNISIYVRARESLQRGRGIVKQFDKEDILFDQELKPSDTTYWGMRETLMNFMNEFTQKGVDIDNVCVIGSRLR